MSEIDLTKWGWTPAWKDAAENLAESGQTWGRVTAVHRDQCLVQLRDGERTGEVSGRFRHEVQNQAEFPAVGDWVLVEAAGPELAIIHKVLPRKNVLSRKVAGQVIEEQVLAANVDVAFAITAFDEDFNVRRIERYVVMARQAGMEPVVLLNKSDLAEPSDERLSQAQSVNQDGKVQPVSAKNKEGVHFVESLLAGGKTGIFLGSSGVGKSTLLNTLLGSDLQKTQSIRLSDGKGRHTTTSRQMFMLPSGGLVIDTPGLREIQLWADESALADAFSDIALLAASCRYGDCQHGPEPGCAVREALASGTLAPDRFQGFVKLQKELAYLRRKQDPQQRANTKLRWKKIHKTIRKIDKRKRDFGF